MKKTSLIIAAAAAIALASCSNIPDKPVTDELTAEENWSRIEWDNVEKRSFFIGPEAYSLFTPTHTVIQGGNDGQNSAPIQLDLTYTMLK